MPRSNNRPSFSVKPEFLILLALLMLVIPYKWVAAWVIAAAFHELCHFAAVRLSGCEVFSIRINLNGAIMETDVLSWGKEILCALAGPLGGFLLIFTAKWFPRLAICGCFQSLYNLLPVYPLDGGRALKSAIEGIVPEKYTEKVWKWLEFGILALIAAAAFYLSFGMKLGAVPILMTVILFLKNKNIKIPCKEKPMRVQ